MMKVNMFLLNSNFLLLLFIAGCGQNIKQNDHNTVEKNEIKKCGGNFIDATIISFDNISYNPIVRIYNPSVEGLIDNRLKKETQFEKLSSKTYRIDENTYVFNAILIDSVSNNYAVGIYYKDSIYYRKLENVIHNDLIYIEINNQKISVFGEFTCINSNVTFYRVEFNYKKRNIAVIASDNFPVVGNVPKRHLAF